MQRDIVLAARRTDRFGELSVCSDKLIPGHSLPIAPQHMSSESCQAADKQPVCRQFSVDVLELIRRR